MKHRFHIWVEADPNEPDGLFHYLLNLGEFHEKQKEHRYILDYGFAVEHDASWLVGPQAKIDWKLEEPKAREVPTGDFPEADIPAEDEEAEE